MTRSRRICALLAASATWWGCQQEQPQAAPAAGTGRLVVTVQALTLSGIRDADYTLQVYGGDPGGGGELVAEVAHLSSSAYGDGAGDVSYVAPCDASTGTNYVRLVLNSLTESGGGVIDPATYRNPTPLTKAAACVADADTPVDFNLTVVRDATQGFFDVAVSFENIFCSAKFDCLDDHGDPLTLLHDRANGERATTMVLAFACTSGGGRQTWLHMSDVYVRCEDAGQTSVYWLSPGGEPGNRGAVPPVFYQTALYAGDEQLAGFDKCYWNLAFGLEATAPGSCTLVADATASTDSWVATNGRSPADTIYPYVHYEVPFTDANGLLACTRYPLNGGGEVTTSYTDFAGATFTWERGCGEVGPITEAPRLGCSADVTGLGATDSVFSQGPSGFSVDVDGTRSQAYALPAGLSLGDCCLNPCCVQ